MKKLSKILIALLLSATVSVATVICCCIAPSVMAHFHKTVTCSHCAGQDSQGKSSNPLESCRNQLTSADLSQSPAASVSAVSVKTFPVPVIFGKYISALPPSFSLGYPPGSPPLGISFTPLYLRTFNLRI